MIPGAGIFLLGGLRTIRATVSVAQANLNVNRYLRDVCGWDGTSPINATLTLSAALTTALDGISALTVESFPEHSTIRIIAASTISGYRTTKAISIGYPVLFTNTGFIYGGAWGGEGGGCFDGLDSFQLVNTGTIQAGGGGGGSGNIPLPSGPGSAGGTAIIMSSGKTLTLTNAGGILAGGGGGGGGGDLFGGGGGGRGSDFSLGGSSPGTDGATAGSNGSAAAAGTGGSGGGGNGGGLGQAGSNGVKSGAYVGDFWGAGGIAGRAVSGSVVVVSTGTIYGAY